MGLTKNLRDLWLHRELLYTLTKTEVVARYKQTFFGLGWSLLQPIMQAAVYTVAFQFILRSKGAEGVPYINFVFANLTLWMFFSSGTVTAMSSLQANAGLVRKVSFPREIIPLAKILSGLFDFSIAFLVMILLNAISGFYPNLRFVYLPGILLIEILFIINLSLVLSVLAAVRRDVTYVVVFLINLYMFVSPVFFPMSALPEFFQRLYYLNPMGTLLDAFKNVVFYNHEPRWYALAVVIIILVGLFFPIYAYFKRSEHLFADIA
jgi:lipopolysaccharide transport system permease protein